MLAGQQYYRGCEMVRAALRCGAHWELHRAGRLLLGLACIWLGTTGLSAEESDYGLLLRESEDSGSAVWLDGRLDLEMAVYRENRNKLSNGVELRRGRLSITSRQHGHWVSQLDADFSDDEVEVKDAWVSVAGEHRGVRLGSFKEPFGLENSISSRYITFAERAMLDALAPRRSIGLAIWSHGRWWYTSAGVFGQGIHRRTRGDEGYALTGRGAVFRGQKSEGVLHIGLSLTRRIPPSGDAAVLFRARPETYVNRDRYLNTGSIPGVEHHTSLGLEAAWVRGPLSVQGEAISTAVARRAPDRQADLWAYYLFGSYLVTGESRPYDREIAEFGRLSPDRRSGAWEVAARYSRLSLNDIQAGVYGGEAETVTAGLNWYATANARVLSCWTWVHTDRWADGGGKAGPLSGADRFWFLQFRLVTYY